MLISKTIKLSTTEQEELKKFIDEHLEQGTIQRSKSPYAMSFFFIKKKNGKLRPVQDYLSPSGHGVASIPIQVLYSHAGPVGTAEDLLSQTTKSKYHVIGQVIRITCKVT